MSNRTRKETGAQVPELGSSTFSYPRLAPDLVGLTHNRSIQSPLKALFEQAHKPDPWLGEFTNTVRARQDAVVERLKDVQDKSVLDKQAFDAEVAPLISAALGGLLDEHTDPASFTFPIQVRYLGAETQPFCDAMGELMRHSGTLLLAYDELARRNAHKSRLGEVEASFKKDKGVTESTIEAGKKVATTDIERLLVDRFNEARLPHDLTGEEEHKGRLLLSRGMSKETQSKQILGWGNVALDTESAIESLCYAGEIDDGGR
ncbi:hypothetical protein H2200_001232 [Cladophialophora chaetospira]|uniref:Uncharacterized protein n=1 Tax=Cladophialophora chaetospira TaxID=386627 RepID=A0AA39CMV2_9EURO|nr:hypothetical protein H2200_001232 [Cladophialophora chaetospira]